MKTINDILDIILKEGIDRALNNLMNKDNYCRVLEQDINKLNKSLELIITDKDDLKKILDNLTYKNYELEKYKTEAIYKQAVSDTIEMIVLFTKQNL